MHRGCWVRHGSEDDLFSSSAVTLFKSAYLIFCFSDIPLQVFLLSNAFFFSSLLWFEFKSTKYLVSFGVSAKLPHAEPYF